jgi:hypothetical protein
MPPWYESALCRVRQLARKPAALGRVARPGGGKWNHSLKQCR